MNFSTRTDFFTEKNALSLEKRKHLEAGKQVIDLSESNPTRAGIVLGEERIREAFDVAANGLYEPNPRGLPKARIDIAKRLMQQKKRVDPETLFLTASTSEAYSYIFKLLCSPGDSILVPKPGYPLFDHLATLESVHPIGYRLEYNHPFGWCIDIESIKNAIESGQGRRIKAIVLINPNNPTGSYVKQGELDKIINICMHNDLAIISDEVFHGFSVAPHIDAPSLYGLEAVLTFTLDGFSKRLCLPQMKLGWISLSGPGRLVAKAVEGLEIICDTFLSAGTPVMNASGMLLEAEDGVLSTVRDRMQKNLATYSEVLEYSSSPHRVLTCEGGWTALIQSPGFASEETLALELLRKEGIYVQPGHYFDMDREAFFAFSLILEPSIARHAALGYDKFFREFH
jgi:hypothetical protein